MPRTTTSKVSAPPQRVIPIIAEKYTKPPMKAWSFSSLQDFEKCKFYSYLKRVKKIPEPVRELPPGKTEHANDRGSRMHDEAEMFVRGKLAKLPHSLRAFETELMSLRESFKRNTPKKTIVELEGEWGMTKDWEPTDYKTAWLRLKLDALVFLSETEAVAVDYKSGRRFGNEVKHAEQLQLYQLITFLRYPKLETIHVELWYLDLDELITVTYHRHQGLRFRQNWINRSGKMMNALEFPANPNQFSCKYCMYGPRGNGICGVGV